MASSSLLPRIVLVTAIALTVVAGGKNYMNRSTIKAALDERQQATDKVAALEGRAKKATDEAKAAQDKLKALVDAKGSDESISASAAADIAKAKQDAQEARSQVQAKETEIADLKKKLADAAAAPAPAPAQDPATLKALADAEKAAAEKEQILKTLQVKAEDAEKKASSMEAENARRAAGLTKPGLEGKILAVNPSWNFVVLSIGDRQGVVAGSSLIVKRGGNMVARLRVTSVEPSTSIADIQVGSTAKGSSVQAGDVVIFPGS